MKMALTRIGKEKIRQLTPITEGGEGYIYEFGNDILKIYKPCVDIAAKEKKVACSLINHCQRKLLNRLRQCMTITISLLLHHAKGRRRGSKSPHK